MYQREWDRKDTAIGGRQATSAGNFGGCTVRELGFDYEVGEKGWMNTDILFGWLRRFDLYIGSTTGKRALWNVDNGSCHGTPDDMKIL